MKFIRENLFRLFIMAFLMMIPILSFAQDSIDGCPSDIAGSGKINNPINACTIGSFIKTLLDGVLEVGIPVVALAVIYCGFLFVEARGNSEKLTKAKDALLYTLIGAAILLGSWAIATLISNTVLAL